MPAMHIYRDRAGMSVATEREHGSRSRYCAGCRCEDCTRANREYNRENHRKLARERGIKPRVAKHGTYSKYRLGCRCDKCMEAHRLYRRAQNYATGVCSPKVRAEDLKPLVECLVSFGLRRDRIALAAGVSVTTLRLNRPTIQRERAKRIESLHWGLHRRHAPFRQHCRCSTELIVLDSFEEVA